jgi:6-pyruvoyl-tetrahydropterin synthase
MWTVVEFEGPVDNRGILLGLDFHDVKAVYRHHLDTVYDHHLLLNNVDPLLTDLGTSDLEAIYPGLKTCDGDPTTENIAKWIGIWCMEEFEVSDLVRVKVEVWETQVNSATWEVIA